MTQTIKLGATQHIEVKPDTQIALVTPSGPQGPPGASQLPPGGVDGQVIGKLGAGTQWLTIGTSTEIDTKIEEHNTSSNPHENVASGRDFSALFLNGLV